MTREITIGASPAEWGLEVQRDDVTFWVPLGAAPIVVGSSRACDVPIEDRTVSARHASFSREPRGLVVRDLGSRNGTYVGGARVTELVLRAGTAVTLGCTTVLCEPVPRPRASADGEPLPGLIGHSMVMRELARHVRVLAKRSAPVLVVGETGAGKELVARSLHDLGPLRAGPYVPLNVAALPRDLVESELFGHERGAFTGAVRRRAGAFSEAAGGTLFLDEIGELPLDAQPKLLRALDGYEMRRVGGGSDKSKARLIAATHAPLEEFVASGRFRRDLYHRLEVFIVRVPSLRERKGDIPALVRHFLRSLEPEVGAMACSPCAMSRLAHHNWPGNVRELRNVLFRSVSLVDEGRFITGAMIDGAFDRKPAERVHLTLGTARSLLDAHEGNISAAARAAGLPRTTFRKIALGEADLAPEMLTAASTAASKLD
jgi:DNA-binding NtrC family response regulator